METDLFDIVAGVLQEELLATYQFIIYLYVLRTSIDLMKRKCLYYGKGKKQTITDADYADDIALKPSCPLIKVATSPH